MSPKAKSKKKPKRKTKAKRKPTAKRKPHVKKQGPKKRTTKRPKRKPSPPNVGGRPSKIDEPLVVTRRKPGKPDEFETVKTTHREAVLWLVEQGRSQEQAAREVGIDPDTVTRWRQRYPGFADALAGARAKDLGFHFDNIRAGAKKDPRISQWYLSKRDRDNFGDDVKGEIKLTILDKARRKYADRNSRKAKH